MQDERWAAAATRRRPRAALERGNQPGEGERRPPKLPKEAISWSKRSRTDNSKSETMGLAGALAAESSVPGSSATVVPGSAASSSGSGLVSSSWPGRSVAVVNWLRLEATVR